MRITGEQPVHTLPVARAAPAKARPTRPVQVSTQPLTATQVGSMLDGSASVAAALQRNGVKHITLIDQRDVIAYLQANNAQLETKFANVVGVENHEDVAELKRTVVHHAPALKAGQPHLLYAGQEASVGLTQVLKNHFAAQAKALPQNSAALFTAPDKLGQREAWHAYEMKNGYKIAQPRYEAVNLDDARGLDAAAARVGFPAVLKPANGGGGLGVRLVHSLADVHAAADAIRDLKNYGGGTLHHHLLEEYINGPEYSMQATIQDGVVHVHSACTKVVLIAGSEFRELGHVAHPGNSLLGETARTLVSHAVKAVGYRNGPLQVDLMRNSAGELCVLEMGFRQSGMAVSKLTAAVGTDWDEQIARSLLGKPLLPPSAPQAAASGTMALLATDELSAAQELVHRAPPGVQVRVGVAAPSASVSQVPSAMQAYTSQFSDIKGRLFIDIAPSAGSPEETIRALFTQVAKRAAGSTKPTSLTA